MLDNSAIGSRVVGAGRPSAALAAAAGPAAPPPLTRRWFPGLSHAGRARKVASPAGFVPPAVPPRPPGRPAR